MANDATPTPAAPDAATPETQAQTPVVTAPETPAKPETPRGPGGKFAPKAKEEPPEPKAEGEGDAPAKAEDAPAQDAENASQDGEIDGDPEPDGSKVEELRAWMDRERNRLVIARQIALDAAALAPNAPSPAVSAGSPATAPTPEAEPQGAKHPLVDRFEALKTEIEADRASHKWADGSEGYEPSPGESKLLGFVGEVLPEIARVQEETASMREFFMVQQSRAILGEAQAASQAFKEAYGVELSPVALIGIAQNGGVKAWAALNGIPESQAVLYLNKDALLQIAESKLGPQLRKAGASKPATPAVEPKAKLPSVARGGGSAPPADGGTMTEDQIIDRAFASVRAKKAVG